MLSPNRKLIYTISRLGKIIVEGKVLDESDTKSPTYIRHEELLRSGIGPTPVTDLGEDYEIALSNLKRRYSQLISTIPGTQEAIERVVLGEESLPYEIVMERGRLKKEFEDHKRILDNMRFGGVDTKDPTPQLDTPEQ